MSNHAPTKRKDSKPLESTSQGSSDSLLTPPIANYQGAPAYSKPAKDTQVQGRSRSLTTESSSSDDESDEKRKLLTPVDILPNPRYKYKAREETIAHNLRLDKVGVWFWGVLVLIPTIFINIIYGVIPLSDPRSKNIGDYWTLTFIISPGVFGVIGYLNLAAFLGSMGVQRPFRANALIVLLTFACVIVVFNILVPLVSVFDFYGFVGLFISYSVTFVGIWVYEKNVLGDAVVKFKPYYIQYLKVVLCLFLFALILMAYIFGFRYMNRLGQSLLPFGLLIFTFAFRKIILSLTDSFPIEMAMLLSGFWVENMDDMFQVLAYPNVSEPKTYILLWLRNSASNIANLLFLTDPWMTFRVWIKATLKGLFTCKPNCKPPDRPNYDHLPDDRGHTNNHPGYLRRQVRFYIWKILSQAFAVVFYLATSAVLRYGINRDYFPFNETELTLRNYSFTLYFAAGNFLFIIISGFVGFIWVRWRRKDIYEELVTAHGPLLLNPVYLALVLAIVLSNGLLAIGFICFHFQIWYAFVDDGIIEPVIPIQL